MSDQKEKSYQKYKYNLAGLFIHYRGALMLDEWIENYQIKFVDN